MVVIKLESSWWPSSSSFVWRRPFKVISRKTFLFLSLSSCYYNLSDVCAFMGCGLFKIVEAFFSGGSLYKNSKTQIASVRRHFPPFCYFFFLDVRLEFVADITQSAISRNCKQSLLLTKLRYKLASCVSYTLPSFR